LSTASGATFPLSVTTVNCSASDGTNTGAASFTVTVRDTVPTVIVGTPGNMTVFGGVNSAVNGAFSFPIVLVRDRRGNDRDGRHYTILVTATDLAGNVTTATPLVVNVHDQSGG
jgi:hypothetical protein